MNPPPPLLPRPWSFGVMRLLPAPHHGGHVTQPSEARGLVLEWAYDPSKQWEPSSGSGWNCLPQLETEVCTPRSRTATRWGTSV